MGVDPVTGGLLVGALVGGALSATNKPPKPKAPPVEKLPEGAAAKQKQKQIGAYGAVDTALTGPGGLGSVKPVNKAYSSLLGTPS